MGHGGQMSAGSAKSFYSGATARPYRTFAAGGSSGTGNLNTFWSRLRDTRETVGWEYAASLHADVVAQPGWVDVCIGELAEHDADLCSVILPIKDDHGLTSTALDTHLWNPRRLTMREVMKLPTTIDHDTPFEDSDIGTHGELLLNTGCWVARVGPWVDDIHFRWGGDRIVKVDGISHAEFIPEDWTFSRDMHEIGRKIIATRKVAAKHIGTVEFGNDSAWGTLEKDTFA